MFFAKDQLNRVNLNALSAFNVIDPFSINYDEKEYNLFTDAELIAAKGSLLVFDCECYSNYFLASFKCPVTKKIVMFEDDNLVEINLDKLKWVCENFCIVGFNSYGYDVPVINVCLLGGNARDIKELGNKIIYEGLHRKLIERELCILANNDDWKLPVWNHIDLI